MPVKRERVCVCVYILRVGHDGDFCPSVVVKKSAAVKRENASLILVYLRSGLFFGTTVAGLCRRPESKLVLLLRDRRR